MLSPQWQRQGPVDFPFHPAALEPPEIRGSNPVIAKLYLLSTVLKKTNLKKKRPRMAQLKNYNWKWKKVAKFGLAKFLKNTHSRETNIFWKTLNRSKRANSLFEIGQSRPLIVYFLHFLITISITQIEKSVDGVLGIQTRGRMMVGAYDTTELWLWSYREQIVLAQNSWR